MSLKVEVRDSLFDPHSSDRRVLVRRTPEDRPLYRVFLYLEGPDLPFVESVTYVLHPTFPDPIRVVPRTPSNPLCKLEIWTWGLFDVAVTVTEKSGARFRLAHHLEYEDEALRQREVSFV